MVARVAAVQLSPPETCLRQVSGHARTATGRHRAHRPGEFSVVIAAIHAAGASRERWPEAVLAAARLMNPRDEGDLALASLDRLALAAFVAYGAARVVDLNDAARHMLGQSRCLRLDRGVLRVEPFALKSAFDEAMRAATRVPARSSLLPLAAAPAGACEIAVSPVPARRTLALAQPLQLALVVVAPAREQDDMLPCMRRLYGLTAAEARVMAALTSGATVDDVARQHGVRASTVRAQVRSIFEKTGVNRQSDLVRLALTGSLRYWSAPHSAVAAARRGLSQATRPQR